MRDVAAQGAGDHRRPEQTCLWACLAAAVLAITLLQGCASKGSAKSSGSASPPPPAPPVAEKRSGSSSLFGSLFGRSKLGTIEDLVSAGKDQEALAFYEQNRGELRNLKPKEQALIDDLQVRVATKRLQALLDAELYDDVPRFIDEHRAMIDALPPQKRSQIEGFTLRARCGEFDKSRRRGGAQEALATIERNPEILESSQSDCRARAREVIESERQKHETRMRELAARVEKLTASSALASQPVWSELGAAIHDGTSAIDAYGTQPLLRREGSEAVTRLKSSIGSADKALRAGTRAAFLSFDVFGSPTFMEIYPVAPDRRVLSEACEALLPRLHEAEPPKIKQFWGNYGGLLSDDQKQRISQLYVDSLQRGRGKPGFVASLPFLGQAHRDGFLLPDWAQRIALLEAADPDDQDVRQGVLALDVHAPVEYKIPVVKASLVIAPEPVAQKPPPEPTQPPAIETSPAASPASADGQSETLAPATALEGAAGQASAPAAASVSAETQNRQAMTVAAPLAGPSTPPDASVSAPVVGTPPAAQEQAEPSAEEQGDRVVAAAPVPGPIRISLGEGAKGKPIELVLSQDDVRGKDMVIAVRFVKPRSTRSLRDRASVRSEYKSAERVLPNPAYLKAKREYEDARDEARALALARSQASSGTGNASIASPSGFPAGSDTAAAKRYVEVLEGILATTPENLREPVYSPYSYVASKYRIEKSVKVQYVVYEVASGRSLIGQTTIGDSRDFAVAEGVRDEDKSFAAIEKKYETIANMEGYAVRSLKVSYDRILADLRADITRRW